MSASQQIVCLPCLCILRKIIEQWSHYRRPGFMGLLHLFHQVRTHLLSQEHILSADLVYLFPIEPYLNLRAQAYLPAGFYLKICATAKRFPSSIIIPSWRSSCLKIWNTFCHDASLLFFRYTEELTIPHVKPSTSVTCRLCSLVQKALFLYISVYFLRFPEYD